jgi:hypothetical protein
MALATALAGCSSGGGSEIEIPAVNPTAAASKAIELYDKDASGSLDAVELNACPGLLAARERYDTDNNGQLTRDEIAARITVLFSAGIGLTPVTCTVFRGSQPLVGATVRLVPDQILGDALKAASGMTDSSGTAIVAIPETDLPADQAALRAMQPGIYRVEFEHTSIKNLTTPLGCEIDPTTRGGTDPVFRL